MKKRVYIETSIVSYLTANPSRDPIRVVHQRITRNWWAERRRYFELCVSQLVLDEAGDGDPGAAAKRLKALHGAVVLNITDAARQLAKTFMARGLLPLVAAADAVHLATACVHAVDVLLTWNCRHLANMAILGDLALMARVNGYELPMVGTPEELMGMEDQNHV